MKKSTLKKHHKWFGLFFSIFILLFCLSGVLLNHRNSIDHIDISRSYLPADYHYSAWNNGLLRGTIKMKDSVLIYGTSGVFKSDSDLANVESLNSGFPEGVDNRNVLNVVKTVANEFISLSPRAVYKLKDSVWCPIFNSTERLTDIVLKDDSLIVVGRSHLFISYPPYNKFQKRELLPPVGYTGKVTLFRTVWLIHSGELFGLTGKIFVDSLAFILVFLSISGVLYWFLPKQIRFFNHKNIGNTYTKKVFKWNVKWHNKIGVFTLVFTLFIAITGWCLRPPMLIPLAYTKVSPIPGSMLSSSNPWNDKLRALRYDAVDNDWILSTSEGFYSLSNLLLTPTRIENTPPVSVMGINVFYQDSTGDWLVGSFSGMYKWNRQSSELLDYFTKAIPESLSAAPFGKYAVSGFTNDFYNQEFIVEYNKGVEGLPMPPQYTSLPMSLWNLALEVHTGRIFTFLGDGTLIYISIAGLLVVWILGTGYIIRHRSKKIEKEH